MSRRTRMARHTSDLSIIVIQVPFSIPTVQLIFHYLSSGSSNPHTSEPRVPSRGLVEPFSEIKTIGIRVVAVETSLFIARKAFGPRRGGGCLGECCSPAGGFVV